MVYWLYLLDGELSLESVVDKVKIKTRQFAKRQRSWFRNQMKCDLLDWPEDENVDSFCELLLGRIN